MAIVKNQDIPLEQVEDQLDPPIPFDNQYRRALSEGIEHPKLPAGEEIVTFSKLESRPAERDSSEFSKPRNREEWRGEFKKCLECWEKQFDTEGDLNPCKNYGHRHYVKPWTYVPGAKNTYFNQFMSDCLLWEGSKPDEPFPLCDEENKPEDATEIGIIYDSLIMGCGGAQNIGVDPDALGCPPYTWEHTGGGTLSSNTGETVTYYAPETNPNCEFNPVIKVTDIWGQEASISIAVNCSTGNGDAIKLYGADFSPGHTPPGCQYVYECGALCFVYNYYYFLRCDNTINSESFGDYCVWKCSSSVHPYPNECVDACGQLAAAKYKTGADCPETCSLRTCGESDDLRTEEEKANGCCPFNWITGLPF